MALYRRMREVLRHLAEDDPRARDPRDRRARRSPTSRSSRRRSAARIQLQRRAPGQLHGHRVVDQRYLGHYPEKHLAAQLFGTRLEIESSAPRDDAVQGHPAGHADRAERPRVAVRHYPRGTDGVARVVGEPAREPRRPAQRRRARPKQGRRLKLTIDYNLQRPATRRWRRRSPPPTSARAPAPTWRWTRATARSSRWARRRASTRRCSRARHGADLGLADVEGDGRAAVAQPRDGLGLSDRIDVQADHGAGGAGDRADQGQRQDLRQRPLRARPAEVPERQGHELRLDRHVRRPEGVLGRVLLPARRAGREREESRCVFAG